ncbi:MAG TPA: TetR/AcrR family transcriptional regulator [Bacillales bacterium]|nr:TetR/AcrR family transcriptional regulator [Bacillales bacterium]
MSLLLFDHKTMNDPRHKLLKAALHLYTEKGFRETSVLEVVERAHVSKTTFYNFFGSKEDLLVYLFQHVLEKVLFDVRQAVEREEKITNKSFAGIRRYLEISQQHRPVAQLLLVSSVGVSPSVEEVRQQAHVRFAELIHTTVRNEIGEMSANDDIYVVAQAIVGAINEVVVQEIIVSDKPKDIDSLAGLLNRIAVGSFGLLMEDSVSVSGRSK